MTKLLPKWNQVVCKYMDTYTSQSLLPSVPVSQSLSLSTPLTLTEDNAKTIKKHKGNPAWKKGVSGNPAGGGRPKGSISLKASIERLLTKSNADEIINTLIEMAKSGSIKHTQLVAQLTGDLSSTPQVNIQSNTLITSELVNAARQFLADKDNTAAITDISSSVKSLN